MMVFAETKEKDSTRAMRRACMNESGRSRSGGHTSCFNRNREEADRRRAGKEERTPRLTDRVGRQVPREQEHSRGQARSSRSEARQDGRWQVAPWACLGTICLVGRYFSVSACVSWLPHARTCGCSCCAVICCAPLRCVELFPVLVPLPCLNLPGSGPPPGLSSPLAPARASRKVTQQPGRFPDRLPF